MQLTKGAIGNLINRYRAVLKKCHLLNVFGSLAVAGMLVMGGAAAAGAAEHVAIEEAALSYDGTAILTNANITTPIGYTLENGGVTITADGVDHTGRGVLTNLYQMQETGATEYISSTGLSITGSTFSNNKNTLNNGAGGGAVSLWSDGNAETGLSHSISSTTFTNNSSDLGGAVAIMKQGSFNTPGKTTFTDVIFTGNTAKQQGGAIFAEAENITISNSTFEENKAFEGGSIYLKEKSHLTITGGRFTNNQALGENSSGGAIYVAGGSTLNVDSVTFTENKAGTTDGSTYYVWGGAILNAGDITVKNSTFTNNISGTVGGALGSTTDSGVMNINGSKFTDNHAVYDGGAIGNYSGMVIEGCSFEGNTAQLGLADDGTWTASITDSTAIGGGAISLGAVSSSAVASISNTTFTNNISGTHGGAIATRMGKDADNSAATLDIAATFIGNQAQQGGAIYNTFYTDNRLGKGDGVTVTGLFSENKATDKGGAIFNDGAPDNWGKNENGGGVMTVTNGIFTNNTAASGGAIYNTGTMTVGGSFTGNTAHQGGAIYNNNGSVTIGNGTVFENNYSTGQNYGGGAIYSNGGSVTIEDNVQFTKNYLNQPISESTSGDYRSAGGAIAAWGSTELNIGKNVTFENNGYNSDTGKAAWASGGAIYLDTNTTDLAKMTIGEGAVFKGNVAGSLGGAIYASDADANISSALFDGNKAGSWGGAMFIGQYYNLTNNKVTINGSTFTNNEAGNYGGALAIHNDANVAVNGSAFVGNKVLNESGLGGAIYNEGKLTFSGNNTFTDNTAAEGNDIYNAGSITVADGTTTLGSGLTQAATGTITVNGGTLDMASGSSLSFAEGSTLTINGGTFVADFDQLLESYTGTNAANGITGENIIGQSGNLNLRLDGVDYTLDEYNAAKNALLGQDDVTENATLNFLNANLKLDEGQNLVVGAKQEDNVVTIQTAPVVVATDEAPSDAVDAGKEIPSVPNQIVSVVQDDESKQLLAADIITISDSEFTAKGLQIEDTKGAGAVTLAVTNGSNVTLTGDEAGFTGVVNAENEAVATNVQIEGEAALTVGLEGNASAQNLTLNEVTVDGGTFAVAGNGLDTTQVEANALVTKGSGTVAVNNATLAVENTTVTNGLLNITNTVADLGTVQAVGGVLFFDPSYGNIRSLENDQLGSKLLVSDGSVVNVASGLDNLQELAQKAGFTTTAIGSGKFTLGAGQSMLAVGQPIQLTSTGQIVVDAGVDASGQIDSRQVNAAAYFGNNSLLVVNGNTVNGTTAAIDLAKTTDKDLYVQNGAKLLIADAVAGQTYTVISGATNADTATGNAFNGGTYNSDTSTGWKGANLLTSSDMVTLTSDNGTVFKSVSADAHTVFPNLSHELATAVNTLYGQQLNDVDADAMGVRFLSRATDNRYLGADKQAAASTIESAARMAFAGAVPQMTKMASDAGTNAVVNRLGFANPADGAQAMNAEGKIVDRNTTGFALWIAPLWQNQHGWGMEAGNLDYGFNGNLGGVSLGADYTFENAIRAGITFNIGGGYAESSGGDLNSTENRMTFWGLGAYAGWNYENFGLMADVSYTSTWNDLEQDMDGRMGMGDLEADVQATAISAGLRAEYKLETSVLDIIPHIGVRYMSLNTWGYDVDTNGGTVLEGDGFHQDIWTFPIGVTFSKDFTLDSGWFFKPSVDFSVIPAAGDIKAKQDVAFTGLPGTYEVETQMMDYLTWQGGVGIQMGNDNLSFGVNYTLQAGQNTTGHGVFGSFRYEF